MRKWILLCAACLGACATDQADYDAECMRLRMPAIINDGASARPASNARNMATGPLPKVVPTDKAIEANCENRVYRFEDQKSPAGTSGEPHPLD